MQKEVEIKIKIDAEQEELLKNWLSENAKFMGDFKITDYYLNNPKSSFYTVSKKGYKEALNFLRVRVQDKANFITFKNREVDDNGNTVSVNEVETKIDSANAALQIFNQLGYSKIIKIEKNRSIYMHDISEEPFNIFEFSFDKINKLGSFLEIELKNYQGDVQEGIQKIYDLLKTIGINKFIQYDFGYITIFLNPTYNFEQKVEI